MDFPASEAICSTCHTPPAAIDAPYETNPSQVTAAQAEGITCDFCHKIWDVWLEPDAGLPPPHMPGVLSFEFRRPGPVHQFFA